jgi:hypothetical protein
VLSSAPAWGSDLNHRCMGCTGSSRVDDGQGVHCVIWVDRHDGPRILTAQCSSHLSVEVDLSGRRPGHRSALRPYVDPPALRRVGVGQIWVDAGAIVLELVEHESDVAPRWDTTPDVCRHARKASSSAAVVRAATSA